MQELWKAIADKIRDLTDFYDFAFFCFMSSAYTLVAFGGIMFFLYKVIRLFIPSGCP